jgi:hypothetical protein
MKMTSRLFSSRVFFPGLKKAYVEEKGIIRGDQFKLVVTLACRFRNMSVRQPVGRVPAVFAECRPQTP